ncbi:hypothetical protein [Vibrio agarivorans]|uniref:DUF3316 domain-containing protein n=1 Tax=Vibrio agarivorans TaxID=153622 RepID=A0ABT7Y0A9_9VIBR|nr:hypothetical protein [Vibrio agarivorans]MDN2481473.1 hypothetical protein [Vibrio agarivorans]
MKMKTLYQVLLISVLSGSAYANARYATQVSSDIILGQEHSTQEEALQEGKTLESQLLSQTSYELSKSQRTRVVTVNNRSFEVTKSDVKVLSQFDEKGNKVFKPEVRYQYQYDYRDYN